MMAAVEQSGSGQGALVGGWRRVEGTLRPRLRDVRAWWARSLASWLPERVRDLFGLAPQRLLLQRRGDAIELALWRGDRVRPLADLPVPAAGAADPWASLLSQRASETPRWLLLPAQAVLRRRLTLPLAAADRLREVLGFEIDRQTPFAADDVSYDARMLDRRGDGQL
ncbi:MAG: general secretion pathway protein GspL, partial [Luteimonas sp.]|nr:general secretion pathway protein GspL [Luteimonas sp.]